MRGNRDSYISVLSKQRVSNTLEYSGPLTWSSSTASRHSSGLHIDDPVESAESGKQCRRKRLAANVEISKDDCPSKKRCTAWNNLVIRFEEFEIDKGKKCGRKTLTCKRVERVGVAGLRVLIWRSISGLAIYFDASTTRSISCAASMLDKMLSVMRGCETAVVTKGTRA